MIAKSLLCASASLFILVGLYFDSCVRVTYRNAQVPISAQSAPESREVIPVVSKELAKGEPDPLLEHTHSHESLEGLLHKWKRGDVSLYTMVSDYSPYTATLSSVTEYFREGGSLQSRPSYDTNLDVFDSNGNCTDSITVDRAESIAMWRPSPNQGEQLLVIRSRIDGCTYCRITDQGRLRILMWSGPDEMNPLVFAKNNSDDPSYEMVVPARDCYQFGFRSEQGTCMFQDCKFADGTDVGKTKTGYFLLYFGAKSPDHVEWVKDFDLAGSYSY